MGIQPLPQAHQPDLGNQGMLQKVISESDTFKVLCCYKTGLLSPVIVTGCFKVAFF